jgi:hypothetical protein
MPVPEMSVAVILSTPRPAPAGHPIASHKRSRMSKRNPTEQDLAAFSNLEITETGYSFDGPSGRVRFENVVPGEEVFRSEMLGVLNISLAWRNIHRSGQSPMTVPINAGLRNNISQLEYDHDVVKAMTLQRRDEPVLMLITFNGLNTIDGAHRLKRRIRDKLPSVQAFILPPTVLREIQVRMFEQQDGVWQQVSGLSDESLAEHIRQAKLVEAMIFRGPGR